MQCTDRPLVPNSWWRSQLAQAIGFEFLKASSGHPPCSARSSRQATARELVLTECNATPNRESWPTSVRLRTTTTCHSNNRCWPLLEGKSSSNGLLLGTAQSCCPSRVNLSNSGSLAGKSFTTDHDSFSTWCPASTTPTLTAPCRSSLMQHCGSLL